MLQHQDPIAPSALDEPERRLHGKYRSSFAQFVFEMGLNNVVP
jgi:hypothetical protein